MSKVIAVFGAGSGLGVALARRFGREGFRVALVARRKDRLDALVGQLAGEGIEAAAFPGDLSLPAVAPVLVDAIRAHFGRIDVVEYGPIAGDMTFTPATRADAATLEEFSRLLLLTPVEVFRAVLPEMTGRGDGALLMTTGYTAVQPMPFMSGPGPLAAAARNYVYSLSGELNDTGVYVGTLTVAHIVTGSEAAQRARTGDTKGIGGEFPIGGELPTVHPDELAQHYWDMYTKRDRVEQAHPAELTPSDNTTTWSPTTNTSDRHH
ncbi:SDR family NAD(P)-dependent oxidoreductase [Streptomyces sp. NPDC056672]|uniref:SDR family NAD(P)-dependent oxidoreductase n=1 Tax=Streptomyces sp. NPDC056672 TaxID=3345906 RepID=UPI003676EE1D